MEIKFDKSIYLKTLEKEYKLTKSYAFSIDGRNYKIGRGFKWNGLSNPICKGLLLSKTSQSVLIHDYMYSKKIKLSRKECDKVLLASLKQAKVFAPIRYGMYFFVRIFGFRYFKYKGK